MRVSFAYAYSPRENVGSRGRVHAIVEDTFMAGRLVRHQGQALCTTKKFWGLDGRTREQFEANACPKCREMMERLKAQPCDPEPRAVAAAAGPIVREERPVDMMRVADGRSFMAAIRDAMGKDYG